MNAVTASLMLLIIGAAAPLACARRPRIALLLSLGTIVTAGTVQIGAALIALLTSPTRGEMSLSWTLPIGSASFALDGLSAWFLLAIGFVSVAVAVYSWGYFQSAIGREPVWVATSLMNVLVGAMVMTVCAADVVMFMVGWEVMSLSAFLLVMFHHQDAQARHGAWTYLVATHLGTAIGVLPVLCTLSAAAGSTAFARFAGAVDPSRATMCTVLWLLGLVGFGAKAGLMPMHVWLPQAHPVAPSPVSALLSGVVIKTGVYGLLRLITWLPSLSMACACVILIVGAVTGVMAILYALAQPRYKRALAYSSVENVGIIAVGIGLGLMGRALHEPVLCALGFGGAVLHTLNHAMFKALLFLSAGAVLHGTGVDSVERLGGLMRRDRVNAALFAFGCSAICALPPLNGFVSEFLIYGGLLRSVASSSFTAAAMGVVGTVSLALIGGLAVAGFTKLLGVMFLGEPRDASINVHATPAPMLSGMFILASGCGVVALGAPLMGDLLKRPLGAILGEPLDPSMFSDTVLTPLAGVSAAALIVILAAGLLIALRRRLYEPEPALAAPPTWGCGFSAPTPRMQYTGTSYAWKLADSFGHLLRLQRTVTRPEGCFATESSLNTHTVDVVMQRGFRPLFQAITRACEQLWPLQHGRIQLYLAYIAGTLLLVFAVEAWHSPFSQATMSAPGATPAVVAPHGKTTPGSPAGGDRTP